MIGRTLGPYEVVAKLGEGGMGEVYRATDSNLKRAVAIKVLPASVAGDADRLARFQREAEVLAALNHPNIAAIYGLEKTADLTALVMELVEGEDLSTHIARGPIPLADALSIARQVADALEAAHEQGIIHRDLKPQNIKVRADGTVKVLDFGLAKAMDPASPAAAAGRPTEAWPTITTPAMTQMGMILGTAAYMAPEQAKGRPVDKRADVWAFGVVLYEMLTGRSLFGGDSVAETIGYVATRDPDWTALPASTPAFVRRLLARCLARDPKLRLRDMGEARIALASPDEGEAAPSKPADPSLARRTRRERTMWMGAAAVLAVAAAVAAWLLKPAPPDSGVVARFNLPLPSGQRFTDAARTHAIAISPDGTTLAYSANLQIYVRRLDSFDAQAVRGTDEGPAQVMFSPDGQSIAYFTRGPATQQGGRDRPPVATLKRVTLSGGPPVAISQVEGIPAGARWHGNTITFALKTGGTNTIQAVDDRGGPPRTLVSVDGSRETVRQALLADDGARVLMSVQSRDASAQAPDIVVQRVDGGSRTVLIRGASDPRLLPSGHLLYVQNWTVYAAAIDLATFELTGEAAPIVEGVRYSGGGGVAQFAVADNGTLAMIPGGPSGSPKRTLVWVDRQGREEALPARPRAYSGLRLSPDDKQVAVGIQEDEEDIWILDVTREALMRLTTGPASDGDPVWTHDGRHVIYQSIDNQTSAVFRRAADGTGVLEKLFQQDGGQSTPESLSRDGRHLVFRSRLKTQSDLMLLPIDPAGPAKRLIGTEFSEDNGRVSPDGRWIAYDSTESGAREIFVRPFPGVETGKVLVSSGGGLVPRWSGDGRELFYIALVNGRSTVMSAAVPALTAGAKFTSAKPKALFAIDGYMLQLDVARDGRFLMIKRSVEEAPPASGISVVTNWFTELRARVKVR